MLLTDITADMRAAGGASVRVVLTNRGFHALLFYRLANWLWHRKIPLVPGVLTRIVQILYAIDIDYRCQIGSGCAIVHGFGLVVGWQAVVGRGVKFYHGVTLGRSHSRVADGMPVIGDNVLIGAGAKVLGKVAIGKDAIIGANAVVLKDVPSGALAVGVPARLVRENDPLTDAAF